MRRRKFLAHTGTKRHSGRYPWGSGEDPYQHDSTWLSEVAKLKKEGMSEVDIAKAKGLSVADLRAKRTIEINKQNAARAAFAYRLKEKGYSNKAISERMGLNDHTVASLLEPSNNLKARIVADTAAMLKSEVDKGGFLDVGLGLEAQIGIPSTKIKVALAMLREDGYQVFSIPIEQVGTGNYTWTQVLAPPGTTKKDIQRNQGDIHLPNAYSNDGITLEKPKPPVVINSDRVYVAYASDKDGAIEIRRGVDDLCIGGKNYAQVRIATDKGFMKGMAMYSDSIPDGYDVVYNVGKKKGTPLEEVYKPIKDDPDFPFGSVVRQKTFIDKDGNEQQSALNVVGSKEGAGEEGSWGSWSKNLSSQVLSKQMPAVAKEQLNLAYKLKEEEFNEIMALTNPALKQVLLKPFADGCDSVAADLKAAPLPGQANHVILPIKSIKPNEIYATRYNNGENVVLIRHPHGGIFEIPELIVNNNNKEAKGILGDALDAVGIHPSVAQRLSGADFDGDTVIVIPNKSGKIQTAPALKSLKNFNPKEAYPFYEGMRVMDDKREKGIRMGEISNLITDMTVKGADFDEIARAVKHSMVVIDAPKHKLNFEQSYIDNGIAALRKKYQGREDGGAATLISRAGSEVRVNQRSERRRRLEEPITGEKLYKETGRTYFKRKYIKDEYGNKIYLPEGKILPKQTKVKRMDLEKDAHKLSSGTRIESVYADHANNLKALAIKARKAMEMMPNQQASPSAKKIYAAEVASLMSKLRTAYRNKPLERQAQILANQSVNAIKKSNPHLDKDGIKKLKGQQLAYARAKVGAKKFPVIITPSEWKAIQAGAISHHRLVSILSNADIDHVKQLATPRTKRLMSSARRSRARQMRSNGYNTKEIAEALGVSISTLEEAFKEDTK